jgi:hypothetical protein
MASGNIFGTAAQHIISAKGFWRTDLKDRRAVFELEY